MTRPRGTVPVKMARHRAKAMALWLARYRLPPKTALGTAGQSESEVAAESEADAQLLADLVAALAPRTRGRRRLDISSFYLPVSALKLLDNGHAAMAMPRKLKPVVRQMLRATRITKGPKLPPQIRSRNLANGTYAPETVRRYAWVERRKAARQAELAALNSSGDWPSATTSPPVPGTAEFAMVTLLAARRWLI